MQNKPRRRLARWLSAGLFLLGLVVVVQLWSPSLPSYDGRRVDQWFAQANEMTSEEFRQSDCYKAFEAMEGDAVPYLTAQLDAQPAWWDETGAWFYYRLPASIQSRLPKPRDATFYRNRRDTALHRLGEIGMYQRFKTAEDEPSTKPSITLAVASIRAVLQNTNNSRRVWAAQAIMYIGPEAAVTIPELIQLADDPESGSAAVQGLGMMGPLASNAVPVLTKIATNLSSNTRRLAVQSIGQIGWAAQSAVPVLVDLLADPDEKLRVMALRSLADTGLTPDAAVPALSAIQQGTNEWAATLAALALWNRDRQNEEHRLKVIAALRGEHPGWILHDLKILGTNAAPFIPEIRLLLDAPDPHIRRSSKIVLRAIQPASPPVSRSTRPESRGNSPLAR